MTVLLRQPSMRQDLQIDDLRISDELRLPKGHGIDLQLSAHYRNIPIRGSLSAYDEISSRFSELGANVHEAPGPPGSRHIIVLLPGVFDHPDLVAEIAALLRPKPAPRINRRLSRAASAAGRRFSSAMTEISSALTPTLSPLCVYITDVEFGAYIRTCPPELSERGLFDSLFIKWPSTFELQRVAVTVCLLPILESSKSLSGRSPSRSAGGGSGALRLRASRVAARIQRRRTPTECPRTPTEGEWPTDTHGSCTSTGGPSFVSGSYGVAASVTPTERASAPPTLSCAVVKPQLEFASSCKQESCGASMLGCTTGSRGEPSSDAAKTAGKRQYAPTEKPCCKLKLDSSSGDDDHMRCHLGLERQGSRESLIERPASARCRRDLGRPLGSGRRVARDELLGVATHVPSAADAPASSTTKDVNGGGRMSVLAELRARRSLDDYLISADVESMDAAQLSSWAIELQSRARAVLLSGPHEPSLRNSLCRRRPQPSGCDGEGEAERGKGGSRASQSSRALTSAGLSTSSPAPSARVRV